jgi:protein phosphatase PTC1
MEDASVVVRNFRGSFDEFFAAVYDGHDGPAAADIAAASLHCELEKALAESANPGVAMAAAFLATDRIIADKEKEKAGRHHAGANLGGAVAVVVYISGRTLAVGNVGDAHVILDRNGRAERLSCAHRASDLKEAQRIRKAGGHITHFQDDVPRVAGGLAVTRSLGDTRLKDWIIAEPFIAEIVLQPGDERLIMACDGLWDWMTDQHAVDLLYQRRVTDAAMASETLRKEALARGSEDNITVIVVNLAEWVC